MSLMIFIPADEKEISKGRENRTAVLIAALAVVVLNFAACNNKMNAASLQMINTVIISLYEAFPPCSGAAAVAYNVARHFPGTRAVIQLSGRNTIETPISGLSVINLRYSEHSRIGKALGLLILFPRILFLLQRLKPNLIIMEGSSWAFYQWLLFALLKAGNLSARFVYHAHNVDALLRHQTGSYLISRLAHWAEGRLLRGCDVCCAVSDQDASVFFHLYGIRPFVLPNGVDTVVFDSVGEDETDRVRRRYRITRPLVLFMGLLEYPPNQEALRFLICQVFPLVVREKPNARLAILGGTISERAPWLLNPGRIPSDDVPGFIKASDICVAPIFSGSGTRVKILEYMAAQRPVVATPKGVEGIAVTDGRHFLMATTPADFAQRIVELLDRPDEAARIAEAASHLVKDRYSWSMLIGNFQKRLEDDPRKECD